nr:hypothetical protein [Desulfolucanica intricata]
MQLAPGERSILAFFPSSTKAEACSKALQEAGLNEVRVDRISRYGVEADSVFNNPIAGRAKTMTGLTLFSADTSTINDSDSRVLMGADPSVYSMGRDDEMAGGHAFLLTAVTGQEKVEEAVNLIKQHGGEV